MYDFLPGVYSPMDLFLLGGAQFPYLQNGNKNTARIVVVEVNMRKALSKVPDIWVGAQ